MKKVIKVDDKGKIELPAEWIKHLNSPFVEIEVQDGKIIIEAVEVEDISDLLGSVEVDLKSDRSDWEAVKRELLLKTKK
ncbi:hypothetical protein [Methanobacterium sp.]|uniref:hypothetical protein n=1 Tax=Methanobacterium sp. TaxID=2164 RepID=UPI003C724845